MFEFRTVIRWFLLFEEFDSYESHQLLHSIYNDWVLLINIFNEMDRGGALGGCKMGKWGFCLCRDEACFLSLPFRPCCFCQCMFYAQLLHEMRWNEFNQMRLIKTYFVHLDNGMPLPCNMR